MKKSKLWKQFRSYFTLFFICFERLENVLVPPMTIGGGGKPKQVDFLQFVFLCFFVCFEKKKRKIMWYSKKSWCRLNFCRENLYTTPNRHQPKPAKIRQNYFFLLGAKFCKGLQVPADVAIVYSKSCVL